MNLKEELLRKWENTGKIGFERVHSRCRAIELIETIDQLYQQEQEQEVKERTVTFKDLVEDMRNFILN